MNNTTRNSGFPLFTVLGVIFVTLKLTGYITWPWVWVTIPFWGPFVLLVVLLVIFGAVAGITAAAKANKAERAILRPVGN